MHQRLLLLAVAALAVPAQILPTPACAQGKTAARDNIDALIEAQARAAGVPASFVHAVVKRESNYNPNAKGGSALGLMQIKHATARGLGYQGDAAGLFDPAVNLRYGIAYLAGAYKTAKGDLARAYGYYNRGYYYAAKRLGIETEAPEDVTTVASGAKSGASFTSAFDRSASAAPNVAAANTALAYAPSPAANAVPTESVEVPLPPRRPASLSEAAAPTAMASLDPSPVSMTPLAPVPTTAVSLTTPTSMDPAPSERVAVPLPPRRPSSVLLASVGRLPVARKTGVAPILEASALPAAQ
ncbi:lytic transglycosylase domain-containing protein [Methylobacterium gossipiicola]|uniref:Transglycosylase SLT domain-containing protein n=1 Tax=Methylobacterium gossipiicola TaxID=582675 RepID=A0A1I2W1E3_9HYPH|nr:transglycosylase SLT domain-containing protein [Methylobacterium gossipiicola]SFG94407.1 Transglycosylase SLT domain-containing protein [Methylobacterium gossipiicola]